MIVTEAANGRHAASSRYHLFEDRGTIERKRCRRMRTKGCIRVCLIGLRGRWRGRSGGARWRAWTGAGRRRGAFTSPARPAFPPRPRKNMYLQPACPRRDSASELNTRASTASVDRGVPRRSVIIIYYTADRPTQGVARPVAHERVPVSPRAPVTHRPPTVRASRAP